MITIIIIPPVASADKAGEIKNALVKHFGTRMVSKPESTPPNKLKLSKTPDYTDNLVMAKTANDIVDNTIVIVLEHQKPLDHNKVITATIVPEESLK